MKAKDTDAEAGLPVPGTLTPLPRRQLHNLQLVPRLPVPQFAHLENGSDSDAFATGLL